MWEKSCQMGYLTRQFFLDTRQNTAVSPLYVKQRWLNDCNNKIHKDCRVASSMPQQSNHKRKEAERKPESVTKTLERDEDEEFNEKKTSKTNRPANLYSRRSQRWESLGVRHIGLAVGNSS